MPGSTPIGAKATNSSIKSAKPSSPEVRRGSIFKLSAFPASSTRDKSTPPATSASTHWPRASVSAARQAGFKGKFAIHPAQLTAIREGFAPSAAEIAHARRVVAAFEEAEREGRGSTSLDGSVVDVPVVKRARAVLEAAADGGVE